MSTEKELRQIIKEEILSLFQEDDVTYNDQLASIEKALFQIKDFNAQGNEKAATQYIGVLMPQIMSMGFDKPHLWHQI